jgi:hypothetical protein
MTDKGKDQLWSFLMTKPTNCKRIRWGAAAGYQPSLLP